MASVLRFPELSRHILPKRCYFNTTNDGHSAVHPPTYQDMHAKQSLMVLHLTMLDSHIMYDAGTYRMFKGDMHLSGKGSAHAHICLL